MENRPGAIGFTRGFSLERKHTVGEQITIEQLIETCKVMTICKAIMHIGITPCQVDQLLPASTTITLLIDRYPACI